MAEIDTGPRTRGEMMRFVANGIAATGVHFGVLTLGMEVAKLPSAGLANFLAALFGITASFLGNRYFVFRRHSGTLLQQAWRFAALYAAIALLHAALLLLWTDSWGFDYRAGFVVATALQVALSYCGNKTLVFAK